MDGAAVDGAAVDGAAVDGAAVDGAAFAEAVVFLSYVKDLQDPRQQGKVTYPLDEMLLLCLLAVLAGAECFTEIALFGTKKLALLRRFRPFRHGTPAHDHLGDILATLDAEQFQSGFVAWVAAVAGLPAGVIAVKPAPAKALPDSHISKLGFLSICCAGLYCA